KLRQCLPELREQRLRLRIGFGVSHQHANAPCSVRLLCPRCERPCGHGTSHQRHEVATPHSATSSAGACRPIALLLGLCPTVPQSAFSENLAVFAAPTRLRLGDGLPIRGPCLRWVNRECAGRPARSRGCESLTMKV